MSRSAIVVGSGSAGFRHVRALWAMYPTTEIALVRRFGTEGLCDGDVNRLAHVVRTLDAGLELLPRPAIGVVASPAPHHPDQVRRLLDAGATVLTEKPLGISVADTEQLRVCPGSLDRLLVGYHLRFGDTAPAIRDLLADGNIGRVVRAELSVGQYLSGWRPDRPPAESVSARRELGGGVLLELSHEIDAARFVLGSELVAVRTARLGFGGAPTDGLVETLAEFDLETDDGVDVRVHLDMVSDPAGRRWRFEGTDGVLEADLLTSTITLQRGARPAIVVASFPAGERDRAETRMIAHLTAMCDEGSHPRCTVDDGLAALAVIDAVRHRVAVAGPVEVSRP